MAGYVTSERSLRDDSRFTFKMWNVGIDQPPVSKTDDSKPGSEAVYSFRSTSRDGATIEEVIHDLSAGKRFKNTSLSDNGHEFRHFKSEFRTSHPRIYVVGTRRQGSYVRGYRGPVLQTLSASGSPDMSVPSSFIKNGTDLTAVGTQLMKAAMPTSSKGNLALTLAELKKDGLPNFFMSDQVRRKVLGLQEQIDNLPRRILKDASGDYLNYQFGIKPLMEDVKDLIEACLNANKIVTDFARGSSSSQFSQTVRRERSFRESVNDEKVYGAVSQIAPRPGGYYLDVVDDGEVTRSNTTEDFYKFTGGFQYKIPINDTVLGQLLEFEQKANHLLGLRLTPAVLYELTTFSWLIDWFFNLGDLIAIGSEYLNNGLVLKYGYIQRHRVFTRRYLHRNVRIRDARSEGGILTLSPVFTYRHEYKERQRAHPFGFGQVTGSLSAYQLSILAALGFNQLSS